MSDPDKPIFLIGMPASGKSKLGKGVAKHFKIPFIDLDQYIEKHTGKLIAEIFESEGEEVFRIMENKFLLQLISERKDTIYICATGGGTPCNHENMKAMSAFARVIYLNISAHKLLKRLMDVSASHRPHWKNKDENEMRNMLETLILRRKPIYEMAESQAVIVDNYKIDLQNLISVIVSH